MRPLHILDCSLPVAVLAAFLAHPAGAQMVSPSGLDASRRTEAVTVKSAVTTMRSDISFSSNEETASDNFAAYAPTTPGDNDIGEQLILRQREKHEEFLVQADAFAFWTDNAAHVSEGGKSDSFWGWRSSVNWHPRLSSRLIADVGVSQDMFRYNKYGFLDFESFSATAGLVYVEPRLRNTAFVLQYEFNRLTQEFDALMDSHSIRFGVQKMFIINRRNSISTSLLGDWDIENNVPLLKRHEYIADVAWRFLLTRKMELSLNYRYTWFDYTEFDRADSLHSIGFNMIYTPKKWLQIYAGTSYTFNDSNFNVYDYEAANVGGGLGARLKF